MEIKQQQFKPDYRILELRGTPETQGRLLASMVSQIPAPFRRNPWEDDHDFLRRCASLLRSVWEPVWLEVAAFAEARGLPPERGLFVRAGTLPMGCSAAVWHLQDGTVIAGRNYDFYERMPTRHLLITKPQRGYAHVGMNGGLVGGRYDGVNERGLFIALHKVMADRANAYRPGIPYHLMPRLALEMCATLEDAVALLTDLPHLAAFNYTLASPAGAMVKLECYPNRPVAILRGQTALAVANDYEHPSLAPLQANRPQHSSQRRKEALVRMPEGKLQAWPAMAKALSNHSADVCTHREFGATLWSGIFDLTNKQLAYAFGAPCMVAYTPIPWPAG